MFFTHWTELTRYLLLNSEEKETIQVIREVIEKIQNSTCIQFKTIDSMSEENTTERSILVFTNVAEPRFVESFVHVFLAIV